MRRRRRTRARVKPAAIATAIVVIATCASACGAFLNAGDDDVPPTNATDASADGDANRQVNDGSADSSSSIDGPPNPNDVAQPPLTCISTRVADNLVHCGGGQKCAVSDVCCESQGSPICAAPNGAACDPGGIDWRCEGPSICGGGGNGKCCATIGIENAAACPRRGNALNSECKAECKSGIVLCSLTSECDVALACRELEITLGGSTFTVGACIP